MLRFLQQLAGCDEIFTHGWLKCPRPSARGDDRRFVPVELSLDALVLLVGSGRSRREDKSVREDHGFMPGRLWNGGKDDAAHIWIVCGGYPDKYLFPGANQVWLDLPSTGSIGDRVLQPEKLHRIIDTVVSNWDPDWIQVSTYKLDIALYPEQPYVGQRVGWLTYVSDRYGPLPPLPPSCDVTRVDDLGSIILINSITRPSASVEAHVQELKRLSDVLEKAGMLAPVPPEQP